MADDISDAILKNGDGSFLKKIQIPRTWYVPPGLIVDGTDYFIRTSPDGIMDPLEFTKVRSVYIVPPDALV